MIVYPAAMLDRLKALRDRPYLVALLLGLAAQLLFTIHLDQPSKIMFDETHYVPAAKALLALEGPRNIEHPLLGKEMIATGIALFGDNVVGYRILGTVAGTASVLAVFALVWLLTSAMRPAAIGAALAALNQTLFVQARTAMLDVYFGAFLLWGIAVLLWAMRGKGGQVIRRWIGAAVLLGLATSTKWSGIPYIALCGIAFLAIRLFDAKRSGSIFAGRNQPHWSGLATLPALLILGLVSIATYFLTFLPAFFYTQNPLTLAGLIPLQQQMYALQTQVLASHTYQSDWWSWPLMIRPIWYFYEPDMGAQRGVLLIGNPVIMWGGLAAVLACVWAWFKQRSKPALAAALLWIASIAIYVIIPKSLGFYYYYHVSGLFVCVALSVAFHHFDAGRNRGREEWFVAASLVAFVYFYPILAASPLPDAQGFTHWTWFPSWR